MPAAGATAPRKTSFPAPCFPAPSISVFPPAFPTRTCDFASMKPRQWACRWSVVRSSGRCLRLPTPNTARHPTSRRSRKSLRNGPARESLAVDLGRFGADVVAKAKNCLLDFLSCAFEARNHPWSRQAIGIARGIENGATIIGTRKLSTPGDAAFANATLGHGLVREDMHAASICHHGVVLWPTLLALSERTRTPGTTLLAAAIVGYEAGAQIGRALFTADLARLFRPTGLVAPLGAALAGSRALGLTEDAATSAVSIAANTSSGLNEWPRAGGSEMYFHPGFAARNAIAAIELAEAGACLQFRANRRAGSLARRARTEEVGRYRDRVDTGPRGRGSLSRLRFQRTLPECAAGQDEHSLQRRRRARARCTRRRQLRAYRPSANSSPRRAHRSAKRGQPDCGVPGK